MPRKIPYRPAGNVFFQESRACLQGVGGEGCPRCPAWGSHLQQVPISWSLRSRGMQNFHLKFKVWAGLLTHIPRLAERKAEHKRPASGFKKGISLLCKHSFQPSLYLLRFLNFLMKVSLKKSSHPLWDKWIPPRGLNGLVTWEGLPQSLKVPLCFFQQLQRQPTSGHLVMWDKKETSFLFKLIGVRFLATYCLSLPCSPGEHLLALRPCSQAVLIHCPPAQYTIHLPWHQRCYCSFCLCRSDGKLLKRKKYVFSLLFFQNWQESLAQLKGVNQWINQWMNESMTKWINDLRDRDPLWQQKCQSISVSQEKKRQER